MQQDHVKGLIAAWIAANRPAHAAAVSPTEDLFETGILDSMQFMQLLLHLEQSLQRTLDIADFDDANIGTIDGLAREVTRRSR